MSIGTTFASPVTTLSTARSDVQCLKQRKNVCFIPVGLKPLHPQHSFRVKRASICAASLKRRLFLLKISMVFSFLLVYKVVVAMSATCAAEQTQTVTRQSSTITVAPIQGKEKSPELDDGGTGFPPRDDDGGGGGGGGGGGHWSGGFFFFGFLAFLGFLKDQESEGPYREERRR